MGHRQLHFRQVAVEQVHVVPGNELLVHLLMEQLRHVHHGLLHQRVQSAQDAAHAHLGAEQPQLGARLGQLQIVHAHDLHALGVHDLPIHEVAGQQHLVGLQVAEADVVGIHGQRDAVLVKGVDVFAPRDHEGHAPRALEGQACDARKDLARGNGQVGNGAEALAGRIDDGLPDHLGQIEHRCSSVGERWEEWANGALIALSAAEAQRTVVVSSDYCHGEGAGRLHTVRFRFSNLHGVPFWSAYKKTARKRFKMQSGAP